MYGVNECAGRLLGSIALRYRQPMLPRQGLVKAGPGGPRRWTWATSGDDEAAVGDGPTARSPRMARLEAVLFLGREPLGSRKLAELADLADGTQARTLVRKLNRMYDDEGCAFRVVEVAGGFQLMSRPKFAAWLRRLHVSPVEVRLSAPAMETLAVVAYRQPVLRATIEAIRGVQCGEILRQLMERDLLRIVGRSEQLGRPFLYGTTKQFLQVFGLRHVDELPRPELSQTAQLFPHQPGDADPIEYDPDQDIASQPIHSMKTGGKSNMRTTPNMNLVAEDALEEDTTTLTDEERPEGPDDLEDEGDDLEDDDLEEDDEDDLEEDDEDDLEDEDEDDEEEEEDLEEDLEEEEWKEVEDDDEEEEEEDEEDEEDWEDDDPEDDEEDWEDDD